MNENHDGWNFQSMSDEQFNRYWKAREADRARMATIIGWMALIGLIMAVIVIIIEWHYKGTP